MTAPLTPPDCDLRDLAYMPVFVGKLLASDTWILATGDEAKAAMTLWARAWHQVPAASLPGDDRILAALSGAGAAWPKVRAVALRGFVACDDGRLYHETIALVALDSFAKLRSQRARTEAATRARWNVPRPSVTDNVTEPVTHSVTDSVTVSVRTILTDSKGREGKGRDKTPPLTSLASPPLNGQSVTQPVTSDVSHGTRLAKDWRLPPAWAEFARTERPEWSDAEIARIAASFADFWHGKPGQAGRKSDWSATWRNWIRRETDRVKPTTAHDDRKATARAIMEPFNRDYDENPDTDPRDVTGESERIDP